MTDELREMARRAIRSGALPREGAKRTWGGLGTGARCALCESKVTREEVELEVELTAGEGRSRTVFMHRRCYGAWEAERSAMEAAEEERGRD